MTPLPEEQSGLANGVFCFFFQFPWSGGAGGGGRGVGRREDGFAQ